MECLKDNNNKFQRTPFEDEESDKTLCRKLIKLITKFSRLYYFLFFPEPTTSDFFHFLISQDMSASDFFLISNSQIEI